MSKKTHGESEEGRHEEGSDMVRDKASELGAKLAKLPAGRQEQPEQAKEVYTSIRRAMCESLFGFHCFAATRRLPRGNPQPGVALRVTRPSGPSPPRARRTAAPEDVLLHRGQFSFLCDHPETVAFQVVIGDVRTNGLLALKARPSLCDGPDIEKENSSSE
jgi:hypothetical protein